MAEAKKTSRRKLLLGGAMLGAVGAAGVLRPSDRGRDHQPYFQQLSDALTQSRQATPAMVIDLPKLKQNAAVLKNHIGNRFHYRIVAKSLPSIPLLQTVMAEVESNRLMLFHEPFLSEVAVRIPDADVLMGKPMPVIAAETFYRNFDGTSGFRPDQQLQWLIDSPRRMEQYRQLAHQQGVSMRISVELDVGLHRGGVSRDEDLEAILSMIEADPALELGGFMGYEPHVAKVPGDKLKLRDTAMDRYQHFIRVAETALGRSVQNLVLNAAGSPTYQYYCGRLDDRTDFPHNELSAGSCLVKGTDFDLDSLADHRPACHIAAPVLKAVGKTEISGVGPLTDLMTLWNPNREQAFYTYGGYWKAKPESPQGLSTNPVWGNSTNQEMYNASASVHLQPDDWIFLRPTQSEFVFLQFGDLVVYDNGRVVDFWPVLDQGSRV
ncbi:DSD1 family PLP-dependent enzyme [Pseudomaricurvus sp.]|uniref:DSD1 family PLP-dependent enzyme n=1 Tax=Pseudomaricurvus sp. TaxID=2004510 RepID=UPI003F6D9E31